MIHGTSSPENRSAQYLSSYEIPGIHMLPSDIKVGNHAVTHGNFAICANGRMASEAQGDEWHLFLDGLIYRNRNNRSTDAMYALQCFLAKGFRGIQELEGSYNILLIRDNGEEGYIISDLLCSRPWYLYQRNRVLALAPAPNTFAKARLMMSLNNQALYEQIRLLHTGYERTLVNEISRVLPGHYYHFGPNGLSRKFCYYHFRQDNNTDITLDESVKWLNSMFSRIMRQILDHPEVAQAPIQLPLTAGLDSRHILAELIHQNRKPEYLRHIRLIDSEYEPVRKIAEGLNIPLGSSSIYELDTADLIQRWLERSSGLVNVHQYYLLQMKNDLSWTGTVNFTGYLMDWLLGVTARNRFEGQGSPYIPIFNRTYSGSQLRKLLIPDAKEHKRETEELFRNEIEQYQGENWFRMMTMDLHHRGLHYTGILDTMLSDELLSFSPGTAAEAYRYASTVPYNVGGNKKARIHALRKLSPALAGYPGPEGIPYGDMNTLMKKRKKAFSKNALPFAKALLKGFGDDPAPNTEHAWIRQNPLLHQIHKRAVQDSALVANGHLKPSGLRLSWRLHQMGGYQAWTLMSIFSAEMAYRVLVKREQPKDVMEWLLQDSLKTARYQDLS